MFNLEKINEQPIWGAQPFQNQTEVVEYLKKIQYYLNTHNKYYTKTHMAYLCDMELILKNWEED